MILKISLFVILTAMICISVESRSFHKIGSRISGDRLIINDTLHSPTESIRPTNHTISFRHPVTMVVTSIELFSDSNVYAEFLLSFENVLHGVITAINVTEFELTVSVYGVDYKNIPENFNSPLTPNTEVRGVLTSNNVEDYNEYVDYDHYDDSEETLGTEVISIGERQDGDKLLYSDFRSSVVSEQPVNHTVTFRYIDNHFLTYAEFKTFDKQHAAAIFSHITDHSIKAVIYDENINSLDVQFSIYGYDPKDKPSDYHPFIKTVTDPAFLGQISSSTRLMIFNNYCYLSILCVVLLFLNY